MEDFEAKLAEATAPNTGSILGAIGIMVNSEGAILYHHASGRQSLDPSAPALDPDSTVVLGSAGKFVTNLAALNLVERGVLTLDEPIYAHLPELEGLPVIQPATGAASPDNATSVVPSFTLTASTKKITLRHLLLHSSGLADPDHTLIKAYQESDVTKLQIADDAPLIAKLFTMPLLFEPGEGFQYGCSVYWTWLLVTRLANPPGDYHAHLRTNIFEPLGMHSSTYKAHEQKDIWDRRLQLVERKEETGALVAEDGLAQGLVCSMTDMGKLLADLVSSQSTLIKDPTHFELLFCGQFSESSRVLQSLRGDPETWQYIAGRQGTGSGEWKASVPKVNWSAAGLVVEEPEGLQNPRGTMLPKGTVAWEGMPNVLWAVNRDKGLGAFFATQLIPFGDDKANALATAFMRDVWKAFG